MFKIMLTPLELFTTSWNPKKLFPPLWFSTTLHLCLGLLLNILMADKLADKHLLIFFFIDCCWKPEKLLLVLVFAKTESAICYFKVWNVKLQTENQFWKSRYSNCFLKFTEKIIVENILKVNRVFHKES